jgi:hypothetical protein
MSEQQDYGYTPPTAPATTAPEQDFGYKPPMTTTSNVDAGQLAALVEQLVKERLAAAGVANVEPARVVTPEEAARVAIDKGGAGLGIDERFAELYAHLSTLAKKVGI